MNAAQATNWTAPFHGVTHMGQVGKPRVTVTDRGSFAELSCWFLGCGLRPIKTKHADAEAAKTAGEQWLSSQKVAA